MPVLLWGNAFLIIRCGYRRRHFLDSYQEDLSSLPGSNSYSTKLWHVWVTTKPSDLSLHYICKIRSFSQLYLQFWQEVSIMNTRNLQGLLIRKQCGPGQE